MDGVRAREERETGRRRGRYAQHHRDPTIDGIKSAKERWLALLAARKATSWSGIMAQRKQIQFTMDPANRREDQTPPQRELPTSITDAKRRVLKVRSLNVRLHLHWLGDVVDNGARQVS